MGDVLSLVEQAERSIDKDKAEQLAHKLIKGKGFDLEDFRDQIQQIRKMGGIDALMDKMPGMSEVPDAVKQLVNDKEIGRMEDIISSMTSQERRIPVFFFCSFF